MPSETRLPSSVLNDKQFSMPLYLSTINCEHAHIQKKKKKNRWLIYL